MSRALLRSRSFWTGMFLVLAAVQILHRTPPVRKDSFLFDFSNVYSASRVWLHGHNAYELTALYAEWGRSQHGQYLGSASAAGMSTWAAVYPPSSLLLFSPFARLNAVPAHLLWMLCSLTLLGLACAALFELAHVRAWSLRALFIACTLVSAPAQGAIGSGQPAVPACALLILAVWAYSRDMLTLSGVLLGLATAVKIQIGGPFLLYYLYLGQGRVVSVALLLFLSITVCAITRMEIAGVHGWASDWQQNIVATIEPGHTNDPRPGGPFRNDIVNLQTLFHVPIHDDRVVDTLVVFLLVPAFAWFFSLVRRTKESGSDLLKLSIVALLSMLPLYHRLYDSIMLMMLLAWALGHLETERRGLAIAMLGLLGELLIPIDAVPALMRRTRLFDGSVDRAWWQGLVVPHHAWGILALAVGGLYVLRLSQQAVDVVTPVPVTTAPRAPNSV